MTKTKSNPTIHEAAVVDTLSATYYDSDGLVEISNTNSDVLFEFHAASPEDAFLAVRQYLGVFGDVVAANLDHA